MEEALRNIQRDVPDVVLSDIGLPGMDGIEILQRMRRIPAVYLTPVLMLTARGSRADMDSAIAAGADDYLVKPFEPEELVRRVAAILLKNDWRRNRG